MCPILYVLINIKMYDDDMWIKVFNTAKKSDKIISNK